MTQQLQDRANLALAVESGRYVDCRPLGTRGQAQVWLAADTQSNRAPVVIKGGTSATPAVVAGFRAEAAWLTRLQYPGLIRLLSGPQPLFDDNGQPYLVLEFLEGQNLAQHLSQIGTYSPRQVCQIGLQVCRQLDAIHTQGCLHNDIKPANLMYHALKVTVIDFSSAASLRHPNPIERLEYTEAYCAPERRAGQSGDERSDIFSLGVTLYELLTGHHPFIMRRNHSAATRSDTQPIPVWPPITRGPLIPLGPDVPEPLRRAIESALAEDPAQRFPSVAIMRSALATCRARLDPVAS